MMRRTTRRPAIRYAENGQVSIAYQVFGDGPPDLVVPLPFMSHLEHNWELPALAGLFRRLATIGRVIMFDQRGVGLSDPVLGVPTLEERMEDMRVVMDTVGAERAWCIPMSDGGPVAILFAATHPERLEGLILYGTFARRSRSAVPVTSPREFDAIVKATAAVWGTGAVAALNAPSLADDEEYRRWGARLERLAASPATLVRLVRASSECDVRDVLSSVRVPTLVVHRRDDPIVPIADGRYLAEHIRGARFVELEGHDHGPQVDHGALIDVIEEFVTGRTPHSDSSRVFVTIMFTDIVGSTERIAAIGDRDWRKLLESHDRALRRNFAHFDADEIRSTGDGFMATFDGPVRAIRCGHAVVESGRLLGLRIRVGLHAGECELIGDSVGGMAVHIAARVAALADADEVLVSNALPGLTAGSNISFKDRGVEMLKGVPEPWRLFSVEACS